MPPWGSTKLAPAFVINTAVAPLFVGCVEAYRSDRFNTDNLREGLTAMFGSALGKSASGSLSDQKLVNQWFYEQNGIVTHVLLTILASMATDVHIVVQPLEQLKRRFLAPFTTSQHKLNKLWRPPAMHIGRLHAFTLRTISMALIWGPVAPLVLPVGAAMLGVNFWSLRFAVAHWFAKPPTMTEAITERLRVYIGWMVPIAFLVKKLAYGDAQAETPFVVSLILWGVYLVVDFVGFYSFAKAHDKLDVLDTKGEPFHAGMQHYVCPKAQRGCSRNAALTAHLSNGVSRSNPDKDRAGQRAPGGEPTLSGESATASPTTTASIEVTEDAPAIGDAAVGDDSRKRVRRRKSKDGSQHSGGGRSSSKHSSSRSSGGHSSRSGGHDRHDGRHRSGHRRPRSSSGDSRTSSPHGERRHRRRVHRNVPDGEGGDTVAPTGHAAPTHAQQTAHHPRRKPPRSSTPVQDAKDATCTTEQSATTDGTQTRRRKEGQHRRKHGRSESGSSSASSVPSSAHRSRHRSHSRTPSVTDGGAREGARSNHAPVAPRSAPDVPPDGGEPEMTSPTRRPKPDSTGAPAKAGQPRSLEAGEDHRQRARRRRDENGERSDGERSEGERSAARRTRSRKPTEETASDVALAI